MQNPGLPIIQIITGGFMVSGYLYMMIIRNGLNGFFNIYPDDPG
jgi:hypothetical protein